MPVALLREVDAHTVAMLSSWVGRSAALDRTVAALAEHLAKLHVVLLGLLVLGPDATVRRRHRITALRIGVVLPLTIAAVGAIGRLVGRQRPFASAEDRCHPWSTTRRALVPVAARRLRRRDGDRRTARRTPNRLGDGDPRRPTGREPHLRLACTIQPMS